MIIGTSPNGVFKIDESNERIEWIFKGNFFGIDRDLNNFIYLAERKKWGTILRVYDFTKQIEFKKYYFKEVHDVHQIYISKSSFNGIPHTILTDTKHNSILAVYSGNIRELIPLNANIFEDVNHVNALCIDVNQNFYVGLNNKGAKESQVVINYVAEEPTQIINLNGVYHSHDLEYYRGDILISASHQGFVYSFNKKEPLFYTGDVWTRGICISNEGIWVGFSAVSPRSSRQDPNLKNSINLFSHDKFELVKSIEVPEAGQINDIIYIDNGR